jgi:hypothetical protein
MIERETRKKTARERVGEKEKERKGEGAKKN